MSRGLAVLVGIGALLLPGSSLATRPPTRAPAAPRHARAVKAFDTTATIADPGWFAGMYDRGFRLYVLHATAWGTCTPWANTQAQLAMALRAGLEVAAYTRDPRCWRQGIAAAGPYAHRLQFFALDVETDPGVRVTRAMVDGVAAAGVRPVIYTGSGMWPAIMGAQNTRFGAVPLWDTDTRPSRSPSGWRTSLVAPAPVRYGGWNSAATMRKGVQQAFEVSIDGVSVDLSSFDAGFLRPPPRG